MSVRDLAAYTSTDFGGAWTYQDAPDIPPSAGLSATNVEFLTGQVSTRKGFATAYAHGNASTALYNWLGPLGSLVLWYRVLDDSIRYINLSSPSPAALVTTLTGGHAFIAANAGSRLYTAIFNTSQAGVTGRVFSYQSATFVSDTLFQPPITYTPSAPTEPGAGVITAGTHKLGYLIEYRSGFITAPSPSTSGSPGSTRFSPVSFTAAGSKNAQWTLNTTWPTGAVKVHVIMTTTTNTSRYYFVPGANAAVTGGSPGSISPTFSISDDDLIATAREATEHMFFNTQTTGGTAPFNPAFVVQYGDRMVYGSTISDGVGNNNSCLYISNKNAYQEVTTDQHTYQLPGSIDIVTAQSLNGTLYIFGPHWTYGTIDNGDVPATWAAARLVDGRRGTLAIRGVEASPSGQFLWVADSSGLYVFDGGVYPLLPVSYNQTDIWERINWAAKHTVQVKDDARKKIVHVAVPLDSATSPSHILSWDYTKGVSPAKVDFAIREFNDFPIGAIEIVQNYTSKRQELWLTGNSIGGAQNMAADPSMEMGTGGAWSASDGLWQVVSDAGNAHAGTYVSKRIANGSTAAGTFQALHNIPVYAGQAMALTGWVKTSGSPNGTCYLELAYYDSAGNALTAGSSSLTAPQASYAQITVLGNAPANAVYARVQFRVASHTTGTWWADDVEVTSNRLWREKNDSDTLPYADEGCAIEASYQTSHYPPKSGRLQMLGHRAADVRVFGSGVANIALYNLDDQLRTQTNLITLDTTPGREYHKSFSMNAEAASYLVSANYTLDPSFEKSDYWTAAGGWGLATDETNARTGTHVAIHSGAATSDALVQSTYFTAAPNDIFTISAWSKAASADGHLYLSLTFYNSSYASLGQTYCRFLRPTTYAKRYACASAPASTAYARVELYVTGKTTGTYYVDDVSVTKLNNWMALSSIKHYFAKYLGYR